MTSKISMTAGISLIALLALTACGGDDDADSSEEQAETTDESGSDDENQAQAGDEHVFEFEQAKEQRGGGRGHEPHNPSPGEPVTVQLSDELKELAPDDNSMTVESYTLSPNALDEGACRLDIDMEYTDGGLEAMAEEEGVDLSADPDEPHAPGEQAGFPLAMWLTDTMDGEMVDELPSDEEVSGTEAPVSSVGTAQVYFTDDYSRMSFVDECNQDVEESFMDLHFPGSSDGVRGTPFAQVRVSVLEDESVILSHASIRGVQPDDEGNWESVN